MKREYSIYTALLLTLWIGFIISLTGCKKDPKLPTLTTEGASDVTVSTAKTGGNITSNGGAEIIARGVCWGLISQPLISDPHTSDGNGDGSFTSTLTGLLPGTTYYVRAYATNSVGTNYGDEVTFTTEALSKATVTTTAVTVFTHNTATAGGNVISDGNATITDRGVYFGTTNNPQTTGTKIAAAAGGTGTFTCSLTNLAPGTLYYVAAYATNSEGTAFGTVVQFTTATVAPTVITADVTVYTQTTATAGGNVTSNGGAAVNERGVYYGPTPNPETTGTKFTASTAGSGVFTCNLTNLIPATQYYVRAYAINSIGTDFGDQVAFVTRAVVKATLTTTGPSSINNVSAVIGGNITADGGGSILERGICWSTTPGSGETWTQVADGNSGTGSYSVSLSGLSEATLYYVRAYAENSAGTAFGDAVTVLTYMSDLDNNIYRTVRIGDVTPQIWMAENLKTTKYRNGVTGIPLVTAPGDWSVLATPAYCWYGNNEIVNKPLYGALYNWFAVNTGNLCPTGWHVPTDEEFKTLERSLGMTTEQANLYSIIQRGTDQGTKMKSTSGWYNDGNGTNSSGFNGLPGGYRYGADGGFYDIGKLCYWWSSTEYEYDNTKATYRRIDYNVTGVLREGTSKKGGKFIRCIKN